MCFSSNGTDTYTIRILQSMVFTSLILYMYNISGFAYTGWQLTLLLFIVTSIQFGSNRIYIIKIFF